MKALTVYGKFINIMHKLNMRARSLSLTSICLHKDNLCFSIFSTAVRPAVSGFAPLSTANREHTGWLKDRGLNT